MATLNETTETKTQSASDVLLEAMSRNDIYSAGFKDLLKSLGISPESLSEISQVRKLDLAVWLKNTMQL